MGFLTRRHEIRILMTQTGDVSAILDAALSQHRRGQLQQAEQGYRAVLAAQPQHAQGLHLLGILALQVKQPESAIELISRSLRIEPDEPVAHLNLGTARLELGRAQQALESFEQALKLAPHYADAWNNHGNVLLELKRPQQALSSLNRALELQADFQ